MVMRAGPKTGAVGAEKKAVPQLGRLGSFQGRTKPIGSPYDSWGDLNLTVSTPRALTLTVLTVSMPRNNREKRISSKILMNVVSDFGFFFYGMRFCHEKTARKNGRLGTPHRNPAESLLFLKVLNSRLSLIAANQVLKWLNSIPFCVEFNN